MYTIISNQCVLFTSNVRHFPPTVTTSARTPCIISGVRKIDNCAYTLPNDNSCVDVNIVCCLTSLYFFHQQHTKCIVKNRHTN